MPISRDLIRKPLPLTNTFAARARRYAIQLLAPASILGRLAGRDQIETEDIGEMNELFLDAKTSASLITQSSAYVP
jgi:DNA helicase TIP49 (TBP-interacting protein)